MFLKAFSGMPRPSFASVTHPTSQARRGYLSHFLFITRRPVSIRFM
jgi:hypothetical protein